MTDQSYLVSKPVFFSWKAASSKNFFSKSEWRRRGHDFSDLNPDGLVVIESEITACPSWRPVLAVHGDDFLVASVWFDCFSSELVSVGVPCVDSSIGDLPKSVLLSDFLNKKVFDYSRFLKTLASGLVSDSSVSVPQSDFLSKNSSESESQKSSDFKSSSKISLKKIIEGGGGEEGVDTIRWKEFPEIDRTPILPRTSEVNNFVINQSEPRQRKNENHPCWIPKNYPIEQTPIELRDSLLKLSNLVYLYSQSQPNPDDFVSLKKEYLRNQFGKQITDELINFAFQTELLEPDNQYTIGEKAKGYRFTEKYRNQPHRIINTLRTKKEQAHSDKVMGHRDHKHIRYLWEHLTRLTVNKSKLEAYRGIWEIYEPCLSILNGYFYLSQDDFGGRWYSNLTNLKKEARGLLRIEGKSESLWEIDIKNSQPLFASLAAQNAGFHDEGFSTLCHQGTLYEALASLWGMSREEAKEELLRIFYSKNGYRSKEKTIFENQFLTFSRFMFKSKKLNHIRFANLMQTTERKFIVDAVVPELIRQSGGIFVATIHDSLIVEKKRAEFAHDVLSGLFMGRYGVKPMTHLKDTGDYLR